jgi:carbonic anhydrase/acetyltransferase-like protein (isoleucine patch superfamily)
VQIEKAAKKGVIHMVVYRFEGKEPKIGKGTYVSQSAEVIGEVTIGKQCYVGPGAKLRGDYGKIEIGNRTSIEENCVVHARPNEICRVGDMVTVGHGSILHNCTVRDYAVIGMGAIVSDYAIVGVWSVVGEGCVVKNNQVIEDQKIVVGVPAKVVGEVSEEYQKLWTNYKNIYVKLAKKYPKKLEIVRPDLCGSLC